MRDKLLILVTMDVRQSFVYLYIDKGQTTRYPESIHIHNTH